MAPKSAGLAKKAGYTNVKVMSEGIAGWKQYGRHVVASDTFIKTGNIVLVDLRSPSAVKGGHIPGAVNIPMDYLEDAEFPTARSAPIVLYGAAGDAEEAAEIIGEWGYRNVSLVYGGMRGFTARGHRLASGVVATEIDWVRILGKNEVSIADFRKAVQGVAGTIILDVRQDDEVADGMFANSIHIPLDAIEARMAEIPKDKTIFINCATGARAELALHTLITAGYKTKFLAATVECEDGKCKVLE